MNELETIALEALKRIEDEAKAERQAFQSRIKKLEARQDDLEKRLMDLNGLYKTLQPLVGQLNALLTSFGHD